MRVVEFLGELHDKAGRFLITFLSLALLATDMFVKGKSIDATALGLIVGIYVGGASVAKVAQTVEIKRNGGKK